MAFSRFPPKGYKNSDKPLPHNWRTSFGLGMESATKDSTIVTLFRTSETAITPEAIQVHNEHPSFAQDIGTLIHPGSIVPQYELNITAKIGKAAIATDDLRNLQFWWRPIYTSFLDSLEASDVKTGTDVETIIGMQHDATNKDAYPLYEGTKLPDAISHPLSTIPETEVFGDVGLAVSAVMENVTFTEELFDDAMHFYSNRGMLKKVCPGGWRKVFISQDNMYRYHTMNFTYPTVKRGNQYTFCGILFHLPQAGAGRQATLAADVTDIKHVDIAVNGRFDEWNNQFDQARS